MASTPFEMARCPTARFEVSDLSEGSAYRPGHASVLSLYEDAVDFVVEEESSPATPTDPGRCSFPPPMPSTGVASSQPPPLPLAQRRFLDTSVDAGRRQPAGLQSWARLRYTPSEAGSSPPPPPSLPPTSPQARRIPPTKARTGTVNRAEANRTPDNPHSNKMFSLGQDSRLLGAGHVILNVLRALNVVGLIAVMLSSMAMPILSITKGNFFFFDMITHFFVFFFAGFLLVSELPIPWKFLKGWYERCWPVLGPDHSLAWLGWGMVFIGFQPLGDYWKPGYSVDIIGLAWWRAILAASILCVTFGFLNIVASVVFRIPASKTENGLKVTARQIRSHGTLAIQYATKKSLDINESLISHLSPPHRDNFSARSWNKEAEVEPSSAVKRMTRVLNPVRNFRKSRIQISKPIPQNTDVEHGFSSSHGGQRRGHGQDDEDDGMPQRPPSAMHPSRTGYSDGSRYSTAHMEHF